ncbi:MAG TPA: hypothetical protein VKF14_09070 [Candidatus Dormibacteraeota bacterium]|nr:hypothetical protein [Candidatus Dormibacteraeota bacterium]
MAPAGVVDLQNGLFHLQSALLLTDDDRFQQECLIVIFVHLEHTQRLVELALQA